MAAEWSQLTLRDASVSLIDCDHRTPPAAPSGQPYVAIPQLRGGRIDLTDVRRITAEDFAAWTRKARPMAHDVLLSRRCNPGETAYVPPGLEFAVGQNLVLLRSDGSKVYPPFLRWLTRGPEWWRQIDKFLNVGAVFDSLKCADVPKFKLSIPPLPEQRAIAHILGTLDDKIQLNYKINEALESMGQAIFKSWFVDFDPVRARLAGRRPVGINTAVAERLPNSLIDSKIGPVPPDWPIRRLGDLIDVKHGFAFRSELFSSEPCGDILLTPGNFAIGGGFKADKFKYYDGEVPEEYILRPGDLLVTMTDLSKQGDTLGFPALVPPTLDGRRFLHNQRLGKIVRLPEAQVVTLYLFYLLCTDSYRQEVLGSATGSTVRHTSPTRIKQFSFACPPGFLETYFQEVCGPLRAKIDTNTLESRCLTQLRDTLLPKLLSGEIRVKQAERAVEAAL